MGRFSSMMGLVHVGGAAFDVKQNWDQMKAEGKDPSLLQASGMAALNMALYNIPLTKPFMYARDAFELAKVMGDVGNKLYHASATSDARFFQPNFGGNFADSDEAATMRRRGLAAIQSSRMNARSVLGSEARRLHR